MTVDADESDELALRVPEMDCPSCASKVSSSLDGIEGLESYDVRPTTGTVVVRDSESVDQETVVAAVESTGYTVEGINDDAAGPSRTDVWRSTRAKKTAVAAVFWVAGLLVEFPLSSLNVPVADPPMIELLVGHVLLLVAIAAGGEVILREGYYSARNLSLDIDLLMSIAIVAALLVTPFAPEQNLFVEAASLAVLFNLAELLEQYSVERARGSLRELMAISPDTATVRRDAGASGTQRTDGETVDREEVTIPVDEVVVGDLVVVEPGGKVPVDGVVVEGQSAVDESPITGESVPVDKEQGSEVFAGTINKQGYLEIEATARAEETTLSRIVERVEQAQSNKTEREQFVDRFADYYTPAVVAAAIVTATVPPLVFGAPWVDWMLRGIAFLVIACPCAFVISTPVSVVSAVTSAARNGVLVKGGDHLETMGEVDAVALDKTGTLTLGELSVTDVVPLDGTEDDELLALAAGLERRSEHPIADAVLAAAADAGVEPPAASDFESIAGRGVQAKLDGETYYAGKPALFEQFGFDLENEAVTDGGPAGGARKISHDGLADVGDGPDRASLAETLPRLAAEGKTVVLVGTENRLAGVLAIADEIRPGAVEAVERLHALGVDHVSMLTGDNEGTARAIADQVAVDEYRAGLLPEEKLDAIESLQAEYGTVAMVGDGINDAPALATADVGVAMGAAGTDTAIETADVALLGDDIRKLPYLYDLSHRANGVIRQNIWGSLGVKALLALGIPLGYVSVVVAVLAGDVGMTVLVTGNALRLSRVRP